MAGEQQLNLNVENYLKLKAEKAVRILKIDGVTNYAMKRYDPTTGKATPLLVALRREDVVAEKNRLLALIESLDAVIADIDAAQEV